MKKGVIILSVLALMLSLYGCSKSENLKGAETAVKEIGEVTLESGEAIKNAEAAIGVLNEEEKEKFKLQDEFEESKAKYNNLVIEDAAAKVEKLIAEMGAVSIDNLDNINAVKKEYDALSSEAKELVENYETLNTALETLAAEKKAKAEQLLSTMRVEEDKVRKYKFYYPKGWQHYGEYWAADIKSFVLPYIGVSEDGAWLRMVCNYTSDDWVFFEDITFSVDGTNYYKSFKYSDVVRDNEGGDVWEYVDIEAGDSEIEILKAIAESTETIVRFEGREYYRDFTISAEDKQGIAQALEVYELLK